MHRLTWLQENCPLLHLLSRYSRDPLRHPEPLLQLHSRLRLPHLPQLVRRRNLDRRHRRQHPPPLASNLPRLRPRRLQSHQSRFIEPLQTLLVKSGHLVPSPHRPSRSRSRWLYPKRERGEDRRQWQWRMGHQEYGRGGRRAGPCEWRLRY